MSKRMKYMKYGFMTKKVIKRVTINRGYICTNLVL